MRARVFMLRFLYSLWMPILITSGCIRSSGDSSGNLNSNNQQREKGSHVRAQLKPNDPLVTGFFKDMPEELKEGWRLLTSDGRYRVARPEDFRFPEEAGRVIERLGARTQFPYLHIGFDINRDGDYNDFAAIIVDTTQSELDGRFRLVILNPAKKSTEPYEVHWVRTDQDLSRSVMTTASSRLVLETYLDNGSEAICFVRWNAQREDYFCNDDK